VRSQRGTQFRQWANERLHEPATFGVPNDFDELLEHSIAPLGSGWDSYFKGGPTVPDDFMTERASQHQGERAAI
jgi:hypothetical protein